MDIANIDLDAHFAQMDALNRKAEEARRARHAALPRYYRRVYCVAEFWMHKRSPSDRIWGILYRISRSRVLWSDECYEIADRLSVKYSGNPGSTMRAFSRGSYGAYYLLGGRLVYTDTFCMDRVIDDARREGLKFCEVDWRALARRRAVREKKARTPTQLYRHYDADGELLYVGISVDFMKRLRQHGRVSEWFGRIASVRVEHFASRRDAESAEAVAIKRERPLFNKVHAEH